MLKVLYINATIQPSYGEVCRRETEQRLRSSQAAKKRGLQFISYDMFYGDAQRPGNMGRFAREHSVDAVILSGSDKNTTDREDPWVQEYLAGLKDLLEVPRDPLEWAGPPCPILGICFGHQALACVLGGETSRFQGKVDVAELTPFSSARRHPVLKSLYRDSPTRKLRMIVYHADHVVRVPDDFCPLLTSDYCVIQAMAHRDWPIVSFQPHPEMGSSLLEIEGEEKEWARWPNAKAELDRQDGPAVLAGFADWVATIR